MTYQEIQGAIVACMPSKSLRAAVARTEHVFAPQELLALAYRYAPDQAKKLALLTLLARLCDPADVPVLSGLVLPFLLLPLGSFFSGASLGKRQGFCPLYPVLAFALYLPMVFLLYNASAMFHCCVAACASLLGNLLGAAIRRRRKKVP